MRTVSTTAGGAAPRSALLWRPRTRYPATPAATTTPSPIHTPARDRRRLVASGFVGAPVIWVGASAVAPGRGRAPARPFSFPGDATGCSGHTAVAKSSIVGERTAGAFDSARGMAALGPPGGAGGVAG